MTIEEKITELENKRTTLETLKDVLEFIEYQKRQCKQLVTDCNGNYTLNELGENVYREPNNDDYNYDRFMSLVDISYQLEQIYLK